MRPNQQNNSSKRSRGRNNNGGRKHVNPLSRNYESNGPDVKIRGNASHIAEKYLQLARDAQSSGDSVMAENYLQHAEHYFRIISAAQQTQQVQRSDQYDGSDDDDADEPPSRFHQQAPASEPVAASSSGNAETEAAPAPEAAADTPAETEADAAPAAAAGEEGEAKPKRERRPRRRRVTAAEGVDPAEAPQPELGELPAFITASGQAAE